MTMVNMFMTYFDLHAGNMILNHHISHIDPDLDGHLGSSNFHY